MSVGESVSESVIAGCSASPLGHPEGGPSTEWNESDDAKRSNECWASPLARPEGGPSTQCSASPLGDPEGGPSTEWNESGDAKRANESEKCDEVARPLGLLPEGRCNECGMLPPACTECNESDDAKRTNESAEVPELIMDVTIGEDDEDDPFDRAVEALMQKGREAKAKKAEKRKRDGKLSSCEASGTSTAR